MLKTDNTLWILLYYVNWMQREPLDSKQALKNPHSKTNKENDKQIVQ